MQLETSDILKNLDRIGNMPTLPAIAMEVNNMLQDYEIPLDRLIDVIGKDQSLVAKILKLVNSAFFGLSGKVSNLSHAIALLGYSIIRNAIVSVTVIDTLSEKYEFEGFDIADFWTHSVAVAVISKHLAVESRLHMPDESFIAGLLHDIGKIVLAQYFKGLFFHIWQSVKAGGMSFCEAESREILIGHAQIGAHLAKKWKLPKVLVDSICYHHNVKESMDGSHLLMIVHVADILARESGTNFVGNIKYSEISPYALSIMRKQIDTVPDWFPQAQKEIELACRFFLNKDKDQLFTGDVIERAAGS